MTREMPKVRELVRAASPSPIANKTRKEADELAGGFETGGALVFQMSSDTGS